MKEVGWQVGEDHLLSYKDRVGKAGYSLMELMVTLAIITILTAFAIPAISKAIPNLKLKSLSYKILALSQRARSVAIQKHHNVRLLFSDIGVTVQEDSEQNGSYSTEVQQLKYDDHGLSRLITNVSNETPCGKAELGWSPTIGKSATNITFYPRGTASSGSLFFDNGEPNGDGNNICYAVTSTTSGSVKLRKYLECNEAEKENCWE